MKRLVTLILALSLVPAVVSAEAVRINPHYGDRYNENQFCGECHLRSDTDPPKVSASLKVDREVALCEQCHPQENDHPVEVVPKKMTVPDDLPLDKMGQVICSTCHDLHGTSGYPKLLRANAKVLCTKCHFR